MNGDELGSQQLRFTPGPIRGGEYRFAIGSAGSCMLVLQTVLPALWFADGSSRVEVHGGTHNQAAPSADFICRVWEPLLARMGINQRTTLIKHGFYPAGGGNGRRTGSVFTRANADIARRDAAYHRRSFAGGGSLPRWRT